MSVRVVARLRPLLAQELEKDIIVRTDSVEPDKPPTIVKIPNPRNEAEEFSFTFNGVYGSETTQETLFTSEGEVQLLIWCPLLPLRHSPHLTRLTGLAVLT